ncbi:sarcosine oxidase subunit delta [Candidatus Rariloculus sp.]|uniref:sarcosine oxidase subunit delta n=1 Tax=Candidatus Rariloculus sp. TaxID=3101265 RepID=UPI003D14DEB5
MLLIECPWCGPRAETEFSYGGEAGILRPADPEALSDAEWADYLFYRSNSCGAHRELWNHAQGCRRWFGVERDTVSYRIERSYSLSSTETSLASGSDATVKAGADATAEAGADATGDADSGFSAGKGG